MKFLLYKNFLQNKIEKHYNWIIVFCYRFQTIFTEKHNGPTSFSWCSDCCWELPSRTCKFDSRVGFNTLFSIPRTFWFFVFEISSRLGVKNGGCAVYYKTNRETMVEIGDSVRGKDIYIIQTGTKDVNNNIMELLIMAYACKTSSARNIVGVIPYLPYSKQCKMRKRGCIVSKLLAKMMCKSGLTHIITMDLHQKEIQGFFDCPVDNLRASPFLLQYIQESVSWITSSYQVYKNPSNLRKSIFKFLISRDFQMKDPKTFFTLSLFGLYDLKPIFPNLNINFELMVSK